MDSHIFQREKVKPSTIRMFDIYVQVRIQYQTLNN
jgi:hypothetical protein